MKAKEAGWFEVDRKGLADLMARKGVGQVVVELVSNALDQDITRCNVWLKDQGRNRATLTVIDDDPDGWADLTHSYTLFARSAKRTDAGKRGRFNLGEKLVLSLCTEAQIISTKGAVEFDARGRHASPERTEKGSVFTATIRMSANEQAAALAMVRSVIVAPGGPKLTINGEPVKPRVPVHEFETKLMTELDDDQGQLRRSVRATTVRLYDPRPGETAAILELGIPVVETGDRWHYDVQQRVPLNVERDNVTPAYLRDVRTAAANAAHGMMTAEDAKEAWATDALASPNADPEAVKAIVTKRFGERAVIYDPSDREGNLIAASKGYAVITGGSLPKGAWENVRAAEALQPAGQVTPSDSKVFMGPDGKESIPVEQWNEFEQAVGAYAIALGQELLGKIITVTLHDRLQGKMAAYGGSGLHLSRAQLPRLKFEGVTVQQAVDSLLLHEFGHDEEGNHLSDQYHGALTRLGAKLRDAKARL